MKIKNSISFSEDIQEALEQVIVKPKNRSALIEHALREYLDKRARKLRNDKDLKILNRNSVRLNREAEEVLSYQVNPVT